MFLRGSRKCEVQYNPFKCPSRSGYFGLDYVAKLGLLWHTSAKGGLGPKCGSSFSSMGYVKFFTLLGQTSLFLHTATVLYVFHILLNTVQYLIWQVICFST